MAPALPSKGGAAVSFAASAGFVPPSDHHDGAANEVAPPRQPAAKLLIATMRADRLAAKRLDICRLPLLRSPSFKRSGYISM